jgi:hypothetical protein
VIVGRPATLGAVAPRHGALQIRPKHLEIDDRVQPLEVVALAGPALDRPRRSSIFLQRGG